MEWFWVRKAGKRGCGLRPGAATGRGIGDLIAPNALFLALWLDLAGSSVLNALNANAYL